MSTVGRLAAYSGIGLAGGITAGYLVGSTDAETSSVGRGVATSITAAGTGVLMGQQLTKIKAPNVAAAYAALGLLLPTVIGGAALGSALSD